MTTRNWMAMMALAVFTTGAQGGESVPGGAPVVANPDLRHRMTQLVWDITGHLGDIAQCGSHGRAFTSRGAAIYDEPRFGVLRDWMRTSQVVLPPARIGADTAGTPTLEQCLAGVDQILEALDHHGDDIDQLATLDATP